MSRNIRSVLEEIRGSSGSRDHEFLSLTQLEQRYALKKGLHFHQGKVRDILSNDETIWLIHSDRFTAFDRLIGAVPYRGVILAAITTCWFDVLKDHVPVARIKRIADRVIRAEKLTPFKVEVVVRGFLAGSMLRAYGAGTREFCGVKLPNSLKNYAKLPEPIITPTTKAAAFVHDEDTTAAQLISNGVCTQKEWETIYSLAIKAFQAGSKYMLERDWILADTKYEFGRRPNGDIVLMDEVHTPDSSRFWRAKSYDSRLKEQMIPEMFDKEVVRSYLMKHGFQGHGEVPPVPFDVLVDLALRYLEVGEAILGGPLEFKELKAWDGIEALDLRG